MKQKAIIIYGPPGSGKGTQANLLANRLGIIHFDTGSYLESVFNDPDNKKNKKIQEQKKLFDTGFLVDPSWALSIVKKRTEQIFKAGFGVVFSGSPRTLFETYGGDGIEGLVPFLEKTFNRKNIFVFSLEVKSSDSLKRNSSRLISPLTGLPIMGSKVKLTSCPFTGSPLKKRTLDNPGVIKKRLVEYMNRTKPIENALRKNGYKIFKIDGRPLPYKVHESILKHIK